jgi:hypothetical protein
MMMVAAMIISLVISLIILLSVHNKCRPDNANVVVVQEGHPEDYEDGQNRPAIEVPICD